MIPLSDDNPTVRTPFVTFALLAAIALVWVFVQGAGLDEATLARSVCNLGLVAGEITRLAPVGQGVPIAPDMLCVIDREAINWLTPLTSMFLHGGWMHLIGNGLFLWVFGNNIEDSMGHFRFIVFYLLCGLAAAAAQVLVDPSSPIPMVGASGAISGVMGAYLVLYPRVRVNMLFFFLIFIRVIPLPAWVVLVYWFGIQVVSAWPGLMGAVQDPSGGVAFMAHIGGFIAGVILIKPFEKNDFVYERTHAPRRQHGRYYRSW